MNGPPRAVLPSGPRVDARVGFVGAVEPDARLRLPSALEGAGEPMFSP